MVEHSKDGELKVDMVNAPLDKSKPVTKMTERQVHRAGLITQDEAQALASENGGEFGIRAK
jgi:hypothetical protein